MKARWTLIGLGAAALLAAWPADASVISDPGPLALIHNSRVLTLDCQVMYVGVNYSGGESDGEFWGDANPASSNSCGTWLHFGGTTYGPNVAAYALSGAPPAVEFVPASQSAVTGSGSATDPWTVVTVATAGPAGLVEVRQTDTYVSGDGFYRTRIQVTNNGGPNTFTLYRAGDCYLTPTQANNDDGDYGYGWRDSSSNAVACTEVPMGGQGRVIGWLPDNQTAPQGAVVVAPRGQEDLWNIIFQRVGSGSEFSNTCMCYTADDNGGGLSWRFNLETGQSGFAASINLFSPNGVPQGSVPPGQGGAVDFAAVALRECDDSRVFLRDTSSFPGVLGWTWDLGDGTTVHGSEVAHQYATGGTYAVTLTIQGGGYSASRTKAVVAYADVNCCPALDPLPLAMAFEGQTVRFTVSGHDPDGDALQFAVAALPPGASFQGGVFEWPTLPGHAGYHRLILSVSDGQCTERQAAIVWVREVYEGGGTARDFDEDGIQDEADNCPRIANHAQSDLDHDGVGDACDDSPCGLERDGTARPCSAAEKAALQRGHYQPDDQDHDGIQDAADNCPRQANSRQEDSDGDLLGDACDLDADGDGVTEVTLTPDTLTDNCPLRPNPDQADLDGDGIGDACQNLKGAPPRPVAEPVSPPLVAGGVRADNALAIGLAGVVGLGGPAVVLLVQLLRRRR